MKVFKAILQVIGTVLVVLGLIPTYHSIRIINFELGFSTFETVVSIILIIFLYLVTSAFILAFFTFTYNIADTIREENAKAKLIEKK